jgi:hypothetical protein
LRGGAVGGRLGGGVRGVIYFGWDFGEISLDDGGGGGEGGLSLGRLWAEEGNEDEPDCGGGVSEPWGLGRGSTGAEEARAA